MKLSQRLSYGKFRGEGRYEKKHKKHRPPKARRYRFNQKKFTRKKRY